MMNVENTIMVCSGKGGSGKTTFACVLAVKLKEKGYSVGICDADIRSPNTSILMEVPNAIPQHKKGKYIPVERNGIKIMSTDMILRTKKSEKYKSGLTVTGEVSRMLLRDTLLLTDWGNLDYLVIDQEPSPTGDTLMTLEQMFPQIKNVLITTDDDKCLSDCERIIYNLTLHKCNILGLVGNNTLSECPCCGEIIRCKNCGIVISYGDPKKIEDFTKRMHVHYFGDIYFNPNVKNSIFSNHPWMKTPVIDRVVDKICLV